MRIGIDARILSHKRSGIGVYVINLVERFVNCKDLEIVLFSDRPIHEEYKNITDKAKTVIFGQNNRKCWAQFYLPFQLKKYKIDVYHATWNSAVPVLTRVPGVLTVHDIVPLVVDGYFKNTQKRFKYIFSMRSSLSKTKAIITDAENTKSDLMEHFNVPRDKIKTINLGISQDVHAADLPVNKKILDKYKINSDYIVNIGSFDKRRNAETLIRAFAEFTENKRFACQLVLVGGYDNFKEEMNKLNRIIVDLNLSGKIIFTNYVLQQEMPAILSSARMMVHISLYEGFCFPVLEAMRVGVPVIASNTGSLPEVVGDAASLVCPVDISAVAAQMRNLWNNDSLARELIEKGRQRVKNFYWERTVNQTREVYEQVYQAN